MTLIKPAAETTPADFAQVCQVNQFGVHLGMLAVYGPMARQGSGSIVNVSSLAGLYGQEGQFAYSASKAAVVVMSRVAAKEWGPLGIRVNNILPGAIDTPMLRGPAHGRDGHRPPAERAAARPCGLPVRDRRGRALPRVRRELLRDRRELRDRRRPAGVHVAAAAARPEERT